jgi:phosphohistidine phosphatase
MAKRLQEKHVNPDLMLSSPANRALSTCKRFAEVLGYAKDKIKTERGLYYADEDGILSVIREVKDKHNVLMVFGHNPGLTDFVDQLSNEDNFIGNIPTCGIVSFTFNIDHWQDIDFGKGQSIFFDFPKSRAD